MPNNPTGINGYGRKDCMFDIPLYDSWLRWSSFCNHLDPPDDILSASLHQYAKERLTNAQRLERLIAEHGLNIK